MANEFKVKNGLIVVGDLTTSGTITINGALAATQSWVTSQGYLTSASLSGYATQSYVTSAIAALVDSAPAALDTLNELAAALGDDANFSTTITTSIGNKVSKSGDTMTGSLLFTAVANNVRLEKSGSFLNLLDTYSNIHLYNGGNGIYIDSNVHYWRSQGATYWMTLNSAGLGIGTQSPETKLHVAGGKITLKGGSSTDQQIVYNYAREYVHGIYNSSGHFRLQDNSLAGTVYQWDGSTFAFPNGNIGIGTTSPAGKLDVNTGGTSGWDRFVVTNTTLWGDGGTQYVTIGAGGATGIMIFNPHVVWNSASGTAALRLGRSGGVSGGAWYEVGTGINDSFFIAKNGYTNGTQFHINAAGKVSIGTTDTNSDKSDFTVYTGSGASIALTDDQVRMGGADVNWGVALRSYGALQTYGQALTLNTQAGNYAVNVQPNGTTVAQFYQDYSYFPGLDFSISRINAAHASNYFRGDASHLVIGTAGTLYLNYGGSTTNITGTTYINGNLVWHAGNDGSGSGLDADTVDGVQADSIVYGNARGTNDSITTDADGLDKTGYYTSSAFVTKPSGVSNWMYIEHIKLYNSNTYYQKQIGYDTYDDRMWVRTKNNNTWSSWKQIWTSDVFANNSSNWNTAYGWGNHASAGYATTSYVTTQINNLINGAPGALDTLDELAAALGDDANFATTVTNSIAGKMPYYHAAITGDPGTAINGVTRIFPSANGPSGGAHFTVFTAMQDNSFYGWQFTTIGSNSYFRSKDTTYTGWYRLWSNADFSSSDISNWTTAYGWGNHASAGYALNSALANYLPLSGGSIGGALTVNGNLTVNGTITENSSIKLKENVKTSEGNLEKVVNLRPVTYNKIGSETKELGLIAEEVAEVYPEFVQYDENGDPIGVHYSRLTAALIGAVKELTKRIETLENNG